MFQHGPVDCHTHVVPGRFPDYVDASEPRWPCMVCGKDGKRVVTFDGKPFRELDTRSWDVEQRVASMDADGVAVQLLSPMPELLSYWFAPAAAEALADFVNGFIGDMVAAAPARFRGLGMVPLQDPSRAVRMLSSLKARFGLDGVQIGSNILGVQIGDTRFEPVWAAAEDLGLSVFVHALHPLGTKDVAGPIGALAGFPLDTGQAAASFLLAGVMERYPRLRIGFSHGGGVLGALLGRLDQGWRLTKGFGRPGSRLPSDVAKSFFYDSNVYDPAYLRHIITKVAPGQVFLGTDYPYDIMQHDPLAYLKQVDPSVSTWVSLQYGAARRFLGVKDDDAAG